MLAPEAGVALGEAVPGVSARPPVGSMTPPRMSLMNQPCAVFTTVTRYERFRATSAFASSAPPPPQTTVTRAGIAWPWLYVTFLPASVPSGASAWTSWTTGEFSTPARPETAAGVASGVVKRVRAVVSDAAHALK